jgi:SAM-dependent methyltransferase
VRTREPQYASDFALEPVTLGPMTGGTWRRNPDRLVRLLSHVDFVAKHMQGKAAVAEIGCSDGFAAPVVERRVGRLDLYDFDVAWAEYATQSGCDFRVHDIVQDGPLTARKGVQPYDGIYALDVLEHIRPVDEPRAMRNICASLQPHGVFIAGCPSLEFQQYASEKSRIGHINCKNGDDMREDLLHYFHNVFRFGMTGTALFTDHPGMTAYHLMLCCEPKR